MQTMGHATRLLERPGAPTDPTDAFAWLEDRDADATRAFVTAERYLFDDYFQRHADLKARLLARSRELLSVDIVDLPYSDERGGLLYLRRGADEQQKSLYHRGGDGPERCLVTSAACGNGAYASIAPMLVSPGGRYLMLGVRENGGDAQTLRFYDLERGCLLEDRLSTGLYRGAVFTPEKDGLYYSIEDNEGEYSQVRAVRKHLFGCPANEDTEVHVAGNAIHTRLLLRGSEDGQTLGFLHLLLGGVQESRFFLYRPEHDTEPRLVAERTGGVFSPVFGPDGITAVSTVDAADGKVERFRSSDEGGDEWTEYISPTQYRLKSYHRRGSWEILHYDDGGYPFSRVRNTEHEVVRIVTYPREGAVVLGQIDFVGERLFYSLGSPTQPDAIAFVDLNNGEHGIWWEPPMRNVPSISVEEICFTGRDGTQIPLTLLRPRDVHAKAPVVLSAYGFSGASSRPRYSVLVSLLVEEGFICAVAHVRGGGEGGKSWREGARRGRKQTSVDDLIDAAEWLVATGIARSGKLALAGQSFGALLVLCGVTQRPELFRAVLTVGPLTDLKRFHLFGVARGFVTELGSPDNPDEHAHLAALSPYHRVRADTTYPAMYFVSGHCDLRCDGMHARKMVAKLRYEVENALPVVLDYNEVRGHKPVLPLANRIEAVTHRACFLIAELNDTKECNGHA